MANTTFNGPVRSENGFQEWDGSAWVPIGGGGGGTVIVKQWDDVDRNIVLPTPTTVGQTYTIIIPYKITVGVTDPLTVVGPTVAGSDIAAFIGTTTFYNSVSGGLILGVQAVTSYDITPASDANQVVATITYCGITQTSGGPALANFNVSQIWFQQSPS